MGYKPRDHQKQDTGNDCDIIVTSGGESGGESLSNNVFLLYLSVHWGDFIEQINKKSVIDILIVYLIYSLLLMCRITFKEVTNNITFYL